MARCKAFIRGNIQCEQEADKGYSFCDEHKKRPNAVREREEKAFNTVIDATQVFNTSTEVDKSEETRMAVPKEQQTIMDKAQTMIDNVLAFEEKTRQAAFAIPIEKWRYEIPAGEQMRSEIGLYERAQDRVIRMITAVAKLNIDAQSVNLNKMLRELIKSCVVRALTRHGMNADEINTIRGYLAEEFERAERETG